MKAGNQPIDRLLDTKPAAASANKSADRGLTASNTKENGFDRLYAQYAQEQRQARAEEARERAEAGKRKAADRAEAQAAAQRAASQHPSRDTRSAAAGNNLPPAQAEQPGGAAGAQGTAATSSAATQADAQDAQSQDNQQQLQDNQQQVQDSQNLAPAADNAELLITQSAVSVTEPNAALTPAATEDKTMTLVPGPGDQVGAAAETALLGAATAVQASNQSAATDAHAAQAQTQTAQALAQEAQAKVAAAQDQLAAAAKLASQNADLQAATQPSNPVAQALPEQRANAGIQMQQNTAPPSLTDNALLPGQARQDGNAEARDNNEPAADWRKLLGRKTEFQAEPEFKAKPDLSGLADKRASGLASQGMNPSTTALPAEKSASGSQPSPAQATPAAPRLDSPFTPPGELRAAAVRMPIQTPLHAANWSQALAQRVVWLASNGVQGAQIQINPQDLGPMEIKISVQNDQTNVSFVSQHAAVRDVLEASVPRLREMLSGQGLDLVNVDISDQSPSDRSDAESKAGGSAARYLSGSDAGQPEQTLVPVAELRQGLVDFYA